MTKLNELNSKQKKTAAEKIESLHKMQAAAERLAKINAQALTKKKLESSLEMMGEMKTLLERARERRANEDRQN